MISSINDLTIYGIFSTNFPKLVGALEHSKDHIKVELQATKKRIIELSGDTVEEVYLTDKVTVNNPVVVDHSIEIPEHDE